MEGVGSRHSRASSRYASSPSPVFQGRVRKWKKEWVTTTASPSTTRNRRNDAAPTLLLRRWTPASEEEPRKRRFRYAPIVPIEKGKLEGGDKVTTSDSDSIMLEKPVTEDTSIEDTQELKEDQTDSNKS